MLQSQKHVFWQALIFTILIFFLGIIFGLILENWRNSKVEDLYSKSEISMLDIKAQTEVYSTGFYNCEKAISENILFADKVYNESKVLDRYQKSSVLKTEEIVLQHEKYDILRALLWINSIKIKNQCNASYYNVVYIYKYHSGELEMIARETVFSKLLGELKERKGSEVLLIPLASDNNISSIALLMDRYNISKDELPVILIDEKIKINQLTNIDELEKYFEKKHVVLNKTKNQEIPLSLKNSLII